MKEKYEKSYIAIPVKEGPLLHWLEELNPDKKFFHTTFYFLGTIDEDQLNRVKDFVSKVAPKLNEFNLKPQKLAVIGQDKKAFVVLLENSQVLNNIRNVFETGLSQFMDKNLPFIPHITIKNLSIDDVVSGNFDKFMNTPDKSNSVGDFFPKNLGVYYRTDEGATALLFSKKI